MKPWREVARPHEDVLTGEMRMSDFAADLNKVAKGTAPAEYQDAVKFFDRTYITEGMKELLLSVANRMLGRDGDPVIQLKTNFGGGKTHTMLAVYHLATRTVPTSRLKGIPQLLDGAGLEDLPTAKCAVIVGNNLSPNEVVRLGGKEIRTLWGHFAYQLLGVEGYEMVEASDRAGTAPSKELITELLEKAAPCVVLLDELVTFMRQLINPREALVAGTIANNMTFIQSLTEAVAGVRNAILLASLPQSEDELVGNDGKQALVYLEQVFNRIQAVWKPVGLEEAFEIVRRRLFSSAGAAADRDATCRAYAEMYRHNPELFPTEVQEAEYLERMKKTYPLHPELFERLYTDWSTLENFQKTRGVLQYMAIVINRLWAMNNADPMIMPGSLPLSDNAVEAKATQYLLRTGWSAIIQREIDGNGSVAGNIDQRYSNIGAVQAAERAARAIFLGSAPGAEAIQQNVSRGIEWRRVMLGAAVPGQQLGVYEDAIDNMTNESHYLNVDHTKYYYNTQPNLRREMEERRSHIEGSKVRDHLRAVLQNICGRGSYLSGVHVFTPSEDVDDNIGSGPKLIVVRPESTLAYLRQNERLAFEEADRYLKRRGQAPRTKQNRLLFLFPDYNIVGRLEDQCKTYLAWEDILEASRLEKIILDTAQLANAETNARRAKQQVEVTARQCYHFLLVPEAVDARTSTYAVERVGAQQGFVAASVEQYLLENDLLIRSWSPVFLKQLLEQYYFKGDVCDVSMKKVWEDLCSYLYMPRLQNEEVLVQAVIAGVRDRSFGFASGKEGDAYVNLVFGNEPFVTGVEAGCLLLLKSKAQELACQRCGCLPCKCAPLDPEPPIGPTPPPEPGHGSGGSDDRGEEGPTRGGPGKRRFWGTIELDSLNPMAKLMSVSDEVLGILNSKQGVRVTVKLDITAESATDFTTSEIRNLGENCNTLGFQTHGFD